MYTCKYAQEAHKHRKGGDAAVTQPVSLAAPTVHKICPYFWHAGAAAPPARWAGRQQWVCCGKASGRNSAARCKNSMRNTDTHTSTHYHHYSLRGAQRAPVGAVARLCAARPIQRHCFCSLPTSQRQGAAAAQVSCCCECESAADAGVSVCVHSVARQTMTLQTKHSVYSAALGRCASALVAASAAVTAAATSAAETATATASSIIKLTATHICHSCKRAACAFAVMPAVAATGQRRRERGGASRGVWVRGWCAVCCVWLVGAEKTCTPHHCSTLHTLCGAIHPSIHRASKCTGRRASFVSPLTPLPPVCCIHALSGKAQQQGGPRRARGAAPLYPPVHSPCCLPPALRARTARSLRTLAAHRCLPYLLSPPLPALPLLLLPTDGRASFHTSCNVQW